jgi:hypothetical protein
MYIDSVTGTLQSLNDTAGNLNRIKSQYERDRLARAELLNRMGQDETAEKALWDANHSGLLSRLLPNTATGRGAEGAFLEDTPETMQLQSLNPLSDTAQKGQNVLSAFSNAKGGVESLAGLNGELYNGINSKMLDDSGKVVAQGKKFNPVKGDKAFAGELGAYDKETADNAQIEADNRKAQAYNESIPQFKQKYEGNEPDQLNQLADDTLKAIKFYEQRDPQKAAAAYVKYVQTGRAIAQGFQHNFTPLGSEYFFSPKKGGGGTGKGKMVDYFYGTGGIGGKGTLIQLPEYTLGDEEAQMKYIQNHYKKLWASEPNGRLSAKVGTEGTEFQTPEDRARTEELQNKISLEKNAAWEDLVNKYDGPLTSRAAAREKALAELKSQGKDVRMDQFGRYVIIEVAGNNRNVVQSNPEDEVTF